VGTYFKSGFFNHYLFIFVVYCQHAFQIADGLFYVLFSFKAFSYAVLIREGPIISSVFSSKTE